MKTTAIESGRPSLTPLRPPEPFTLVIFGGTGDLAARKLLPALFSLCKNHYLPSSFVMVGVGRRPKSDDQFRQDARKAVNTFADQKAADAPWENFAAHLFYQQ